MLLFRRDFYAKTDVKKLMMGAHFLQLNDVVDACTTYLDEHLLPSNCLDVMKFAESHHFHCLKKRTQTFVMVIEKNAENFLYA